MSEELENQDDKKRKLAYVGNAEIMAALGIRSYTTLRNWMRTDAHLGRIIKSRMDKPFLLVSDFEDWVKSAPARKTIEARNRQAAGKRRGRPPAASRPKSATTGVNS